MRLSELTTPTKSHCVLCYCDVPFSKGGVDIDGEIAANLSPLLKATCPYTQLEIERIGTELDQQCLWWRIVYHQRVRAGDLLQHRNDKVWVSFPFRLQEKLPSLCHSEEHRDEESLRLAREEERFFASAVLRLRMTLP